MSTIEATSKTTTQVPGDSAPQSKTLRVFLTRGVIAIAWAAPSSGHARSLFASRLPVRSPVRPPHLGRKVWSRRSLQSTR